MAGLKFGANTKDEMAAVGMRMMISNNFAPKTRLRMASRLLIMEVCINATLFLTIFSSIIFRQSNYIRFLISIGEIFLENLLKNVSV